MPNLDPGLDPERLLRAAFAAAIDAASAARCVPPALPPPPAGRTVVVGAGKAAAAMARIVESHWYGEISGTVVTPHGHAVVCERIEVLESAHPVPADAGRRAAERLFERVHGLGADDLVLCLVSGGGSALLPLPAEGLSLEHKQALTRALLRSGATIGEINTVRRHLSRIKGGRLGVACHPARLVTLAISDVPGDEPWNRLRSHRGRRDHLRGCACSVLARHRVTAIPRQREGPGAWRVGVGQAGRSATGRRRVPHRRRAAGVARGGGTRCGGAGRAARDPVGSPRRRGARGRQAPRGAGAQGAGGRRAVSSAVSPAVRRGDARSRCAANGCGGRNVEFLLGFGTALGPCEGVHALAGDTDGVDGMAAVAGAVWRPDTLARAAELGLDPQQFLDANDAHSFFGALGDSVVTGPTLTNVNDFRAVLVLRERG